MRVVVVIVEAETECILMWLGETEAGSSLSEHWKEP